MIFSEYDCDNEDILEFLSYLPITTAEEYPWVNQYINDLLKHYSNSEYNLATISAHIVYMFIIASNILKKKEFDLKKIKTDFSCNKELCPKTIADISPFLYRYKDKKIFSYLKLHKHLKEKHDRIVAQRDSVAHCTNITISESEFNSYIKEIIYICEECVEQIFKPLILTNSYCWRISDEADKIYIISDFLLSDKEYSYIEQLKHNDVIINIKTYLTNPSSWEDMLNNTIPANYGINGAEFYVETLELDYDNINEDFIQGTFTADVNCNINFQMASSNPDDGYEEHYDEIHNISGTFEYDLINNKYFIELDNQPAIDFYAE